MKTVKMLSCMLGLVALSFTSNVYANDGEDPEVISNLRSKIIKLVDDPNLGDHDIATAEVKLRFYMNRDNEIVVVESGTENNYLDNFLKSRLNYQKIKGNLKPGMYNIKITFKAT
jgi:hypothetical protein